MTWTVVGEDKGKVVLVSKSNVSGLLPKGSYLTIDDDDNKFILRVDESGQNYPYSPSPMIVDMDLSPLSQDQKCQNVVTAFRVKTISKRTDGLIDYIKPQTTARRSNQEEISKAIGEKKDGVEVFPATVYSGQTQILTDEKGNLIKVKLPNDMFFHQMLICGKTGRGKTVATKYLSQFFVENFVDDKGEIGGAVLAINVKDVDFLKMDRPTETKNHQNLAEWKALNQNAHPIEQGNFTVYYPANTSIKSSKGVTPDVCKKITLDVKEIEPESLIGLLQGISDIGAQNLPNIFRFWKEETSEKHGGKEVTFSNFVTYFSRAEEDKRLFRTLNSRREEGELTLHKGTFDNILRNLDTAKDFFDNVDAETIDENDILVRGKMSVIDVTTDVKGIQFGSILLRDLLHRIVAAKSDKKSNVPILIIIDEVHMFYNTEASREALGDLDVICRTGRSQKIGVIFSSQTPADIPKGLSSVINTKIFFNSDQSVTRTHGITVSQEEMETLGLGFAVGTIYDMSQLKIMKFPLSFCGVVDNVVVEK